MRDESTFTDSPRRHCLQCLSCGYDLRALRIRRRSIRCPECGHGNDLDEITSRLVTRRRTRRQADLDLTAFLIVGGLAAAAHLLGSHALLDWQLRLARSNLGLLAIVIVAVVGWLLSFRLAPDLTWSERLVLIAMAMTVLLFVPLPWNAGVLAAWLIVFAWRVRGA